MPSSQELFRGKHLRIELLDMDRLIKVNNIKEVTNPVFFTRNNVPTVDGLLSNEIFGITKYDRANTVAYINLYGKFLNPLIYKIWCKLDSNIRPCIHGINNYSINSKGELVEDEDGDNGIEFLMKNIDKYKFRRTESTRRDANVDFVKNHIGKPGMIITKFIVIPAFYRDVNTDKGRISVGEINELYRNLIVAVKALKESSDYGLTLSGATRGRVQELLLSIYDWFGQGTTVNGEQTTNVIPGKTGILRMSVMSKTTDYASRIVISAPELKYERFKDIDVNFDYSKVPLSHTCSNFLPFVIFHVRRLFEKEFSGDSALPVLEKDGKIIHLHPKDYQIEFSDDRIKKEIDRFLTGYSNRFIPVEVPTIEGPIVKMRFKGYNMTPEEYARISQGKDISEIPMLERDITWADIFYQCAVEAVKDKHIMITRYPIDTVYNQFPTKVKVSSTIETEPMILGNTFYKDYPKIRQEDIGTDTSNKFIDTLNLSNLYLKGIGGNISIKVASN